MKDFKFNIGSQSYTASVNEIESGQFEVAINGKTYHVEVPSQKAAPRPVVQKPAAAPAPQAAPAAAAAPAPAAAPASGGGRMVTSPLPGTVLSVSVSVGDAVKAGDTVAVVEAMKMQNNITAEFDGTVKAVLVSQGSQVQGGDALVELA